MAGISAPRITLIDAGQRNEQTAVKSRIEQVLQWNDWDAGLSLAKERNQPALVLAEFPWSNSAKRLAYVLENDERLRDKVGQGVVPIFLHPDDRPDIMARLRWGAVLQGASIGPPLMMLVTPSGLPIAPYTSMSVEGNDAWPSLASVIDAAVEAWSADPDTIQREAESMMRLDETPFDEMAIVPELDHLYGGLAELPKSPDPSLMHRALDAIEAGEASERVAAWLRTTLDGMARGAMHDHLGRGFHRCARDPQWMVPHFEKITALNAQLAAVYLRAAAVLPDAAYTSVGEELVEFSQLALREGVTAIESDSVYYTWTSRELLKVLEPSLVQTISLFFGIVPDPHRQALARQIELDDFDQYSHESREVHEARLRKGIRQLQQVRQARSSPGVITSSVPSQEAETVRALLIAARWSPAVDVASVVGELDELYREAWEPQAGFRRGGAPVEYWLEDQVSLLSAMLAAGEATGESSWIERSTGVAGVIVDRFRSEQGDYWLDRPGADTASVAVIADIIPASLATLDESFRSLSALTGDRSWIGHLESTGASQAAVSRNLAVRFA